MMISIVLVILHAVQEIAITQVLYFAIQQISKHLYNVGLRFLLTV